MASKSVSLTLELLAHFDRSRKVGQSYDNYLRNLVGLTQNVAIKKPFTEDPDYIMLVALKVGESCLLKFERNDAVIPVGEGKDGELTRSQAKIADSDMTPTNLRHLSQVVRRVREIHNYQLHVEGRPRGQMVYRIS